MIAKVDKTSTGMRRRKGIAAYSRNSGTIANRKEIPVPCSDAIRPDGSRFTSTTTHTANASSNAISMACPGRMRLFFKVISSDPILIGGTLEYMRDRARHF